MINIGEIFYDRYKVISFLGSGGMSDVYEAKDIIFNRPVVIKILKKEFKNNIENIIRIQNEARISAYFNSKNIVKIYDYAMEEGLPFIVNEYVETKNLREILDFKRYFSLLETCSIMIQILDGVSLIHEKRIIHRDLKPLNIFYFNDGTIKISDFGISIFLDKAVNIYENQKIVGTAQYLAPELLKGKKPSIQSDIYSLGVIFYELLTGKVPFDGDDIRQILKESNEKNIPSVHYLMPRIPKEVDKIIKIACAKKPENRFKSCEEFKNEIIKLKEKELYK